MVELRILVLFSFQDGGGAVQTAGRVGSADSFDPVGMLRAFDLYSFIKPVMPRSICLVSFGLFVLFSLPFSILSFRFGYAVGKVYCRLECICGRCRYTA